MAVAADWERPDRVVGWRFDVLYKAGYRLEDARVLARKPEVDLHEAVAMIRRCGDSGVAKRLVI